MSKVFRSRTKFWMFVGIAIILLIIIQNQQKPQKIVPATLHTNPQVLTEDEKFILNPPPADASKSAKIKHATLVSKLAKDSPTLAVNNCQPDPLVLKTKQGFDFQIKNQDDKEVTIEIDSQHFYKIPPKNSLTIQAKFKYGTGDYGYVCNGMKLAGFLHIL